MIKNKKDDPELNDLIDQCYFLKKQLEDNIYELIIFTEEIEKNKKQTSKEQNI